MVAVAQRLSPPEAAVMAVAVAVDVAASVRRGGWS